MRKGCGPAHESRWLTNKGVGECESECGVVNAREKVGHSLYGILNGLNSGKTMNGNNRD